MAQIVKLRRSAVPGQKPTNSNLQLGELAQNTNDGKIFLAKSGSGGPSIEEIIVTNTSNTGSINLLGSVSASNFTGSFTGDGALLYNIPASGVTGLQLDRITSGNVSASISTSNGLVINTGVTITGSINATQFTGSGLGLTNVPFHISGSDVDGGTYNKQFTKLQFDDSTGLNVSESVAGTAFISIGSHFRDIFVSGSDMLRATGSDAFEIIPEGGIEVTTSITDTNSNGYIKELKLSTTTLSSSLDTRIDNLSGSVVYQSETSSMTVLSSSYALTASFALNAGAGNEGRTFVHVQTTPSTYWIVTHNLGEEYPAITVYDSLDNVVVPSKITTVDETRFTVEFSSNQTGRVSATVGGGLPFVSASFVDYVLAVNNDVPYWKGGIISGSSQIILTGTTGYSAFSSSISSSIGALSSSIAATDLLDDQRLDAIETTTSSLNSFTSSTNSRLTAIETSTGSLNTFSSSTLTRLSSLETESGSIRTNFNTFTSSYINVSSSLDSRLDVLEAYSGSQQVPTASFSFRTAETSVYCKNTSGYQINKGQVVRIVGSVGDNPLIATASYENDSNSANTLGFAKENIPNDSFGMVITEGVLLGVNTLGMTGGDLLYLGANGSFTTVSPTAPLHGVRLGEVLRVQQNNGSIYVRIDNGIELNEAHDVAYTSISSGDLLVRSGSVWINSKQLTGSYHITGSINATSLTGSINYNNLTNVPTLVSGSSQILLTGTTGYSTFSSSVATTTLNIETRVGSLETESGSVRTALNNYTSSANGRLTSIETSTSSLNTFTSSTISRLNTIETSTSSLNTFSSSTNSRLTSIETSTGSLNSFTSSTGGRLTAIETSTSSLNTFTSSTGGRLTAIETSTSSLNTFTSSTISRLNTIETSTGSLNSFTSSTTTSLTAIHTSTASLNSFTSSANTRLGALETESGSIRSALNNYTSSNDSTNTTQNNRLTSLETSTSSLNTYTSSTNTRLGALETESGSIRTAFNSYTSSNDGTNTAQNNRLTSLEGKTGSYATTGSNIFLGTQIVTGSLFVTQDLIIGGSSSIQHITSSQLNIGDNIITVNAQNPSIRFGGLAVIDSGSSPQVSGSILFDSINDQWIFVHQNQSTITSSILLMGPQTFNNLGNESYPTVNKLIKSLNAEHLGDSNITDTGTKVSINSNTEITGTFVVTGTALVSGSSQINHNTTTNYVANQHIDHTTVSISAGNGLSGGGDISATRTLTLDTGSVHFSGGVKSKMNTDGVISGSAQVVAALPSGTVSGSSQVLNGSGVWSGSAQLPSGVVSGSSQVSFNGITDKPALVSGSSQVFFSGLSGVPSGLVSGSSQVSYTGLSNIPSGIVSGSSQVSFSGISGVPSGLVSGSSQISFGSISGVPSGLVSGSSQISFGSISGVPSGLVSGSSQISFGSISGVPSGLVSGSSQISIASTSGFGTYINQALLTTSTPTFSTVSATTFTGALSGNATTASSTQRLDDVNNYTWSSSTLPTSYSEGMQLSFVGPNAGEGSWQNYGTVINARTYSGGGGSLQMYVPYGPSNGGVALQVRFGDYSVSSGNAWTSWKTLLQSDNYNSYAPTLTGTGASGTWGISISGNAATATTATTATNWGSYGAVPAAGTSFGNANTIGRSDANGYTFFNYINSNTANSENPTISQIIVTNGGDNYYRKASISHLTSAVQSNASGNWSINASNITSYTINQSVGTGNSPTFAGITSNGSTTTNGIGSFISSSDYQIILQGTDTWAGIQFDDSQSSPDYIWYNGSAQTFAIGGGGSNVSGKKLHVHGGMTVGNGYTSTGTQTNGLTVEGNIVAASYVVVGGNYGNNAYNSVTGARLMFGGGDGDAQSNYYIGTNLENYGGNYNKLDLRWHTGIRMGAQAGYGGIRFFDSEDLGSVLFSIGAGDSNVRSHTNLIPSANNSYNLGSSSLGWANVYTNDLHLSNMNKPEGNDIDGTNGNWTIQEGAENLYIINNNNGKKYKISLEEI